MNEKPIIPVVNILLIFYSTAAFFYILFIVQPELYFHHVQPSFLKSLGYVTDHALYPGGLAELTGNLLMQTFSLRYSGAFFFFVVTAVVWFLMLKLLNHFSGKILNGLLALIPFTFVIVLANDYNLPFSVAVSVVIMLLVLLLMVRKTSNLFSTILKFMAGAAFVYWFAGSGYFLLYSATVLCMLLNFRKKSSYILIAFVFLVMAMLPLVIYELVYSLSPESRYFYFYAPRFFFMAYQPSLLFYMFLLSVPLLVVFVRLSEVSVNIIRRKVARAERIQLPVFVFSIAVLLALIGHRAVYQPDVKKVVASDFHCYHNNPQAVSRASKSLQNYNFPANVNYNLAMSKAGKLTDSFFDFFQISGIISLYPDYEFSPDMSFVATDFYYHVGYISEARHWAYESLVFYPYSTRAMKSLVKIHLVAGEYQAAERYLALLEKCFNTESFVLKYKPYFSDSSLILQDEEIMYKRSCIPAGRELSPFIEHRFTDLLEANPNNNEAYEWLMLYYLLEGELEQFMKLYNSSEKPETFAEYEEAVLWYGEKKGIPVVDEYNISSASVARFTEFKKKLTQYKGKQRAAMNAMYSQFGNSYLFYLQFLYPRIIKPDYVTEYDENQTI